MSVYLISALSTTYTLVILAIYYWGALILTYHYLPIYLSNTLPIPSNTKEYYILLLILSYIPIALWMSTILLVPTIL